MRPEVKDFPRNVVDRMIREALTKPANLADLVRTVVPDQAGLLDLERAALAPRDYFTAEWVLREADLPFTVPLLSTPESAGRQALVFVLIEHQSNTDRLLPLRMLITVVGFWTRQLHEWERLDSPRPSLFLSPVLPIVLYTAKRPWGSTLTLRELLDGPEALHAFVPDWGPILFNLSEQQSERLRAGGPWMLFLELLRAQGETAEAFKQSVTAVGLDLAALSEVQPARWAELMRMVIDFSLWCRPEDESDALLEALRQTNPIKQAEVQAMSMSKAAVLIQQGREQGEERGVEQGELREARQALLDILGHLAAKFGVIPEELRQQITACTDVGWLREARGRVFQMQSLAELVVPAPKP